MITEGQIGQKFNKEQLKYKPNYKIYEKDNPVKNTCSKIIIGLQAGASKQ